MGWIARILRAVPKEEWGGLHIDLQSDFWEAEGETTFPALLGAIRETFPHDAVLYFEGGSPNEAIAEFMKRHATPEKVHVAFGTIWPRPQVFHVPASVENMNELIEIAQHCVWAELAVHFHVYRNQTVLLEWHDAFTQPMLLSENLSEELVREFASRAGVKYKKGKTSNQAL